MEEDEMWSALNGTELYDDLKNTAAIYEQLEASQQKFCDTFNVHCINGCGNCCEHFVPDIGKDEAEYLAFGMIAEGRTDSVLETLEKWDADSGVCPLYNKNDAHHCTVYKWRPLICRLFGASASVNKDGRAVFRKCKWNVGRSEVPTEELESHKDSLVIMRDYGLELEAVEAGETQTELLPDALREAINKVDLILELESEADKNNQ